MRVPVSRATTPDAATLNVVANSMQPQYPGWPNQQQAGEGPYPNRPPAPWQQSAPTQDQQPPQRAPQRGLPPDQQPPQTPTPYSPYQPPAEPPAVPRRMAPQPETPPAPPHGAIPQQPSPQPPPQFPTARPATSYSAPSAPQPSTTRNPAFLPRTPTGFRPTPQGFPAIQQPTPAFIPNAYAPPGPPRRRPTGLVVALFSALTLLIGMIAISLLNNQSDSTIVSPEYKNEDWKVPSVNDPTPPLVTPDDRTEEKTLTENNPLYKTSLESPVRCDLELLPGGKQDNQALETHLQTYLGCLTRVWGPTLEKANYKAFQPKITVFPEGGTVTTECGTQHSKNAFYCAADQRIYIAQDLLDFLSADLSKARAIFNLIIAHEYGHTIQGQSGILASGNIISGRGNDSEALAVSRRLETQADCFAGAAMSSLWQGLKLTDADRQDILNIITELGDDKMRERQNNDPDEEGDHGKGKNRHAWLERGLNSKGSLGQCNTFTAPSNEIE